MSNRLHTSPLRAAIGRQLGTLPVIIVSILALCSMATTTAVAPSPAVPEQQKLAEQPTTALLVHVRALQEQIKGLQKELTELISVRPVSGGPVEAVAPALPKLDEQMQQLTRQREEWAKIVQQLQTQLQQVQAGQDEERRKVQDELNQCQERLRSLDEQLGELQRQRLRADYEAALQARAQEQGEPERSAAATAQAQSLAAQLKNLRAQLEQTRRELEQLPDREGPRARELEKAVAEIGRQTQSAQEQLRVMGRERDRERQEAADRQRVMLDSYARGLGRGQEELRQSVETLRQQIQQMSQERQKEAAEWQETRQSLHALQDRMQNTEQWRSELARQQENLRREIQSMNEQLKGVTERATVGTAALRQEIDRLRTDLQRMGQTMGRVEREGLDAQIALRDDVQHLRDQVSDLCGDLKRMHGVLREMLAQSDRSTVGSAGYTWGW